MRPTLLRPGLYLTLAPLALGCGATAVPAYDAPVDTPKQAHLEAKVETPQAPAAAPEAEKLAKSSKPEPAEEVPVDTRPKIAATDHFAYIYKRPAAKGLALGYVRMGTAAPLRSTEPVTGDGCPRGWYAVEPRGYVCLDPRRTTLDLEDPYFKALAEVTHDPTAVWPYSYGFSNGAPMYSRLPTPEEQEKAERNLGPAGSYVQLAEWSAGHEELIQNGVPIPATDSIPALFDGERTIFGGMRNPKRLVWRVIPNGSMVAYAKSFEAHGRVWLVTPDLMLVPADRIRKLRRSTFHGVMLGDGMQLPIAWNRSKQSKPTFTRAADGTFVANEGAFPAKSPLPIKSDPVKEGKTTYYEVTSAPGVFVAEGDVTIARAKTELPRGVKPGQKWIEAKILPGTLTAYEGLTPVRSSMFSPGKGGVPVPGHDPNKYATTALGVFPLEWKERVATMSSEKYGEPKVLWFTDVPRVQYLRAPLAMHVSYWHEDFGNPKSAECVNVSPEDGKWLFDWTDPVLPEGWGAMRPGDGNGLSTPVVVTAR